MIKIIEKRDISYYNLNSLNNYMKVKRENHIKEYDYNSEKEMYISFKIGRINRQKKKIEKLKEELKNFLRFFNSIQLELLKFIEYEEELSKSQKRDNIIDYKIRTTLEHLSQLRLKKKNIEHEIEVAKKEYYDLTH